MSCISNHNNVVKEMTAAHQNKIELEKNIFKQTLQFCKGSKMYIKHHMPSDAKILSGEWLITYPKIVFYCLGVRRTIHLLSFSNVDQAWIIGQFVLFLNALLIYDRKIADCWFWPGGWGTGFPHQGSQVQNHWVAPRSTQPFIHPLINWEPETPGNWMVKSELSPCSGSVTLTWLNPIQKRGH